MAVPFTIVLASLMAAAAAADSGAYSSRRSVPANNPDRVRSRSKPVLVPQAAEAPFLPCQASGVASSARGAAAAWRSALQWVSVRLCSATWCTRQGRKEASHAGVGIPCFLLLMALAYLCGNRMGKGSGGTYTPSKCGEDAWVRDSDPSQAPGCSESMPVPRPAGQGSPRRPLFRRRRQEEPSPMATVGPAAVGATTYQATTGTTTGSNPVYQPPSESSSSPYSPHSAEYWPNSLPAAVETH